MSLKIPNSYLIYIFLLFIPFVGILSNNGATILSYGIILTFIMILFFFKIQLKQLSGFFLFYIALMMLALYLDFIYQQLAYSFNNAYFLQFFGSQLFFFLLFSFFANIQLIHQKYLSRFFKFMVILIFISVLIDYILMSSGFTTAQLMYQADAFSYHNKPLGIFGQFSINSTYIVVFYMLYKSMQDRPRNNYVLFLLLTITIILEDSGSGYIAYLLLLATMLYTYSLLKYTFIPASIIILYLISNNSVSKLSIDYLQFLYDFFTEIIQVIYIDNIYTINDILFGIDGKFNFPIDFGPMFMIAKVGLVYFILYSIAIFYLIYKAKRIYFKMAIFILIVLNIHYATLFYPIMNILLPILMLDTVKKQKTQKILIARKNNNN